MVANRDYYNRICHSYREAISTSHNRYWRHCHSEPERRRGKEYLKQITIYLESSVNELKTSVAERLASQEEAVSKLTESTRQLTQTVPALPEVLSQQIDSSVETKVVSEIESMKKEMKKMTAFIIRTQRTSET